MKIVADKDIPFLAGVLEPWADVVYLRGEAIGPDDVRDADALLVRTRTRCDAALLDGSRVRFVGTATIGFDHVDIAWCASRGIEVRTAAGCNRRGVLQWVSAAVARLASERGLEPRRTTLGVVGVGNVGSLVAEYAARWGFRVMLSDPPRERAELLGEAEGFHPLERVVAESDVLTLHVPLTSDGPDATRHLVGRRLLGCMKPGAVVFNSSRGAVLEPAALREAVATRGFAIDTWNGEPAIDRDVLSGALLATPHIAGYSAQGKATATAMVVNALARHFGLPLGADDLHGSVLGSSAGDAACGDAVMGCACGYSIGDVVCGNSAGNVVCGDTVMDYACGDSVWDVACGNTTGDVACGDTIMDYACGDSVGDAACGNTTGDVACKVFVVDAACLPPSSAGIACTPSFSDDIRACRGVDAAGTIPSSVGERYPSAGEWYPLGALRSMPRAIGWDEMCRLMPAHFDIATQSAALKALPEQFEAMRDNYDYRVEFF